jgi:hypothetical protein
MCRVWEFFEALYMACSRWQVGFDGADWWTGRVGCYPMEEEYVHEEER